MPTKKPVDPYAAVKKRGASVTWEAKGNLRAGRVFDLKENHGVWVEVNVADKGKPRDIVLVRPKSLALAGA